MRVAEWINIGCFVFFMALSWLCPLGWQRRAKVAGIAAVGLGLIWIARSSPAFLSPLAGSVLRDWLPAALLLMPYWQAGQFFTGPREGLQARLEKLDLEWLGPLLRGAESPKARAWIAGYFELAYLLCYPLVPCGLGALYLLRMQLYADEFWTVVLPPTYFCHAMVPFFPTLPPWKLAGEKTLPSRPAWLRELNLWLLGRAGIRANVFPSAHVAASVAVSLEILRFHTGVGLVFLWISISIAFGAVIGRYHYAADALLGAALAVGVFLLETLLLF